MSNFSCLWLVLKVNLVKYFLFLWLMVKHVEFINWENDTQVVFSPLVYSVCLLIGFCETEEIIKMSHYEKKRLRFIRCVGSGWNTVNICSSVLFYPRDLYKKVMLQMFFFLHQLLWNYKLNLTTDPKFESVATEVCKSTIAEVSAESGKIFRMSWINPLIEWLTRIWTLKEPQTFALYHTSLTEV